MLSTSSFAVGSNYPNYVECIFRHQITTSYRTHACVWCIQSTDTRKKNANECIELSLALASHASPCNLVFSMQTCAKNGAEYFVCSRARTSAFFRVSCGHLSARARRHRIYLSRRPNRRHRQRLPQNRCRVRTVRVGYPHVDDDDDDGSVK